jgi:predicted phosphoribosyltransferase
MLKMARLQIISDSSKPFKDRVEAGQLLARELEKFHYKKDVVLGIPRGGVIVASEIARAFGAGLDIVLAHKLGAPENKELAIGAVCEEGMVFVNKTVAPYVGADDHYIEHEKTYQLQEISHKVQLYRSILPKISLEARVVIVTDDGVATGATMQAALWAIRQEKPRKLVLALPVGPQDTVTKLSEDADEAICLRAPQNFEALSRFYLGFSQVEDEQLLQILEQERKRRSIE